LIGNAIDKIGKDGSVVVEEAKSLETTIEFIEGFRFDSGLISKSFYTDEHRGMLVYEKPLIMITDENLTTVDDIYPALQLASRDSRPLIIIANEVSGQAQAALVMNVVRGTMRVAAIKPPRYGEERINILEDLAIATGGKMISRQYGLTPAEIKLEHFGTCQTVESSLRATTFVGCGGNSELIEKQIEDIKQIVRSIEDVNEAERQQERVTRLSSTVAIIRVGGFTEAEVIEKKHRIEDALEAVKAAQESGIVVGGGVSYLLATKKFDEFGNSYGEQILKKAMRSPVLKLASNAGQSGDLICEKIVCSNKQDFGYDFRDNKFKNLRESGIIEPAKVQIEALQNAVSAAVSLIFSSYAVIEI
jgi:chaperonin GroEL